MVQFPIIHEVCRRLRKVQQHQPSDLGLDKPQSEPVEYLREHWREVNQCLSVFCDDGKNSRPCLQSVRKGVEAQQNCIGLYRLLTQTHETSEADRWWHSYSGRSTAICMVVKEAGANAEGVKLIHVKGLTQLNTKHWQMRDTSLA